MIELYEFGLSGNCHKVRLLLSLLGVDYKSHALNGAEREQKSAGFLAINPFGQVPVLKDGDIIIRDSQAILVYLARTYGADAWFPNDGRKAAEITAWLSTAANAASASAKGASMKRRSAFCASFMIASRLAAVSAASVT